MRWLSEAYWLAGCSADAAKGMPGRCLAQFHGRDNSFHPQAVKAERSPAFNDGIRIVVKGLTDLSRYLHQLPDRR
jgi:hypothetical protein